MWKVAITAKAKKQARKLPEKIRATFEALIKEIQVTGQSIQETNEEGFEREALYSLEEVFPDTHLGIAIKGFRYREEMTQKALAKKLGISVSRLSDIECGKRSVDKIMARQLADIFNTDYRVFGFEQ